MKTLFPNAGTFLKIAKWIAPIVISTFALLSSCDANKIAKRAFDAQQPLLDIEMGEVKVSVNDEKNYRLDSLRNRFVR